jgi:hypothetical protein
VRTCAGISGQSDRTWRELRVQKNRRPGFSWISVPFGRDSWQMKDRDAGEAQLKGLRNRFTRQVNGIESKRPRTWFRPTVLSGIGIAPRICIVDETAKGPRKRAFCWTYRRLAALLMMENQRKSQGEERRAPNCGQERFEVGLSRIVPLSSQRGHSFGRSPDWIQLPALNSGLSLHFIWTAQKVSAGMRTASPSGMRKSDEWAPRYRSGCPSSYGPGRTPGPLGETSWGM